jgi:protoporphyrinogen oxidase
MNTYDYIVIGGGIAGLYANYKLSKNNDNYNNNGLLLEKNAYFGGRAFELEFHGTLLKLGAGIMADHNKHLIKLLKKLNIKINTFESQTTTYNIKKFDMNEAIKNIIAMYKKHKDNIKLLTMKQILIKYFGISFAKEFILNCEYHDFIKSNVEYFIKYYDIHDMTHSKYKVLIIKWLDLINKLVQKNCLNNVEVLNITLDKSNKDNLYKIKTNDNEYLCKKIIYAVSLKPLMKLSKNIININYNKYIGSVPFVRIYCYYKNGYQTTLPHFTIVNNKLQKIIKINDNILMASYSDSDNALFWKKIKNESKDKQINIVSKYLKELNINNKIDDIIIAFWNEGVHYYKPMKDLKKTINKLSHPDKNVYVVGEITSFKQGWVEGCIESINRIL